MVEIRKANKKDITELAIMNEEFNETKVSCEYIAESLENSKELVAVAISDNKTVGFICAQYHKSFCYEELSGEITELYVREGYRRKRIAALLIEFIEKELSKKGVKDVKVITNIKNESAKKTYEKLEYLAKNWVVFNKENEY